MFERAWAKEKLAWKSGAAVLLFRASLFTKWAFAGSTREISRRESLGDKRLAKEPSAKALSFFLFFCFCFSLVDRDGKTAKQRQKVFQSRPARSFCVCVRGFASGIIALLIKSDGFSCLSLVAFVSMELIVIKNCCADLIVFCANARRVSENRTAGTLNIGSRTTLSASNSSTNGGPSGNGNGIGNGSANSHSPGGSVLGAVGGPVTSSPTSSPAPQSGQNKSLAAQKQEHPSVSW